ESAEMIDLYFETGLFFSGLGVFASNVYKNAGQYSKAILAAFLEHEFQSGFSEVDDYGFLKYIDNLEKMLSLSETSEETEKTLNLVRSLFNDSAETFQLRENAFFVEKYIILKRKIQTHSITIQEFERYLRLERYFRRFPIFYWNVWQAALICTPDRLDRFIPALTRIISLSPDGPYAQPAREELARIMGYTEEYNNSKTNSSDGDDSYSPQLPDLVMRFSLGNFGISHIHSTSKNRSTLSYDFDLFKVYIYDTRTRFGLDLIGMSGNILDNREDYNYASFFNFDFHYSLVSINNMFFAQVYFAGGPSGIKYTINSDKHREDSNQMFDFPIFNATLGVRLRFLHFARWDLPNFDLYFEYNVLKEGFKVGFNASLTTPLTPLFMLIRNAFNSE
ncbi:MAG: hypothetical protein FWC36_05370, partial [Spirochaetes bacterium]|nr:hypothetical protein [Spirochaetota bacterium]